MLCPYYFRQFQEKVILLLIASIYDKHMMFSAIFAKELPS